MKVIARPLGTGKTKELMDMALEADGIILTTNKRALQVKAQSYGLSKLPIIDLNDLIYGNYDAAKPLYIHKLDDIMTEYLQSDFNLNLAGYSIGLDNPTAEWLPVDDKEDAWDCSECSATVGCKCLYCPGCGRQMSNGSRA